MRIHMTCESTKIRCLWYDYIFLWIPSIQEIAIYQLTLSFALLPSAANWLVTNEADSWLVDNELLISPAWLFTGANASTLQTIRRADESNVSIDLQYHLFQGETEFPTREANTNSHVTIYGSHPTMLLPLTDGATRRVAAAAGLKNLIFDNNVVVVRIFAYACNV